MKRIFKKPKEAEKQRKTPLYKDVESPSYIKRVHSSKTEPQNQEKGVALAIKDKYFLKCPAYDDFNFDIIVHRCSFSSFINTEVVGLEGLVRSTPINTFSAQMFAPTDYETDALFRVSRVLVQSVLRTTFKLYDYETRELLITFLDSFIRNMFIPATQVFASTVISVEIEVGSYGIHAFPTPN